MRLIGSPRASLKWTENRRENGKEEALVFEEILRLIQAHEVIILHRHSQPDGDALGSQIGLKHLLLANFPGKRVYMAGDAAGRYAFMADSVMDEIPDALYPQALAVILDTSAAALISDARWRTAHATARIDHHLFCEKIAQAEAVDSSFESCCGLIAALAEEKNLAVPLLAAQSLYTGMVTDSGRFRYDSTSARTFRLAAFLLRQPLDLNKIYADLYAADFDYMLLRARMTLKIQFTANRAAYIYTTREEAAALGGDVFALSRGMVNVMADIKGIHVWVNFTEAENGVLCELRSDSVNINPVAVRFGGGGHAKASGATVKNRAAAMEMLAALDALAGEAQA